MKKNYFIKIPLKNNPYEVIVGKNIINKYKKKYLSLLKMLKEYLL